MVFVQNKRGNKNIVIIRGILIAVALFFLLGVGAARERIARVLFAVTAPLFGAEQSMRTGMDARLSFFRSKRALLEENKALQEKNAFLTAEVYTVSVIKKENQELKEILGQRVPDRRLLLARVNAQPNRSPYGTLLLDKGSDAGVRVGDIVTVHGDIAIGKIDRVYAGSSVASFFSSPGEKIDARLLEGNIPVVAEGMGGGNFKARVPKGIIVKEGDAVISPVLSSPLLGVVMAVEVAPSDSFQNILFQVPVNIYELKWVEILLEGRQGEDNGTRISNSPN